MRAVAVVVRLLGVAAVVAGLWSIASALGLIALGVVLLVVGHEVSQ